MILESAKYIVEITDNISYFRSKNGNVEGSLTIENNEIVDYDGVGEMPKEVLQLLETYGYDVARHYDQYHEVYIKLFWELKEAKYKYLNKFIEHIYMLQGEMMDNGTNTLKNYVWNKLESELTKELFYK